MAVKVIGAGLAGCEAAWQLAKAGIETELYEMKPRKYSPAHKYPGFAELVCSNSLKAERIGSAAGMLKEEMHRLGSLVTECAAETKVSAGGALAVDREAFSDAVTARIKNEPLITVVSEEVSEIPEGDVIIATGPLTSDPLAASIRELCGEGLYFHDAAAPIVTYESLDKDKVFFASRYGRGEADYINCAFDKDEYLAFYNELINAESAPLRDFEQEHFGRDGFKVYEGCMPIEVLAKRGEDTMRFGPLKPVGITDPRTGKRPYAVVQLRAENSQGTLYNIVGFQTHLKFPEQKRVFSMIPALRNADFVRYGVMHRNTYLNSPGLLDRYYRLISEPRISFAGQMTGVEGYVESCASGLLVGIETARRLLGQPPADFPQETAIGALGLYISGGSVSGNFQPMNINFGIVSPLGYRVKGKRNKNEAISARSLEIIDQMKEAVG